MEKKDLWRLFNICLGLVLFALLIVVLMMVFGMKSAGDEKIDQDSKVQEYYQPKEEKKPVVEEKKEVKPKKDVVVEDEDEEKKDDDKDETEEDKKDDDNDEDDDDKDKELTGVLQEAEEDNEYGANYKMILEGNTEYTYFWLSGEMEDDKSLVGKKVKIDVEYQDDGTFIIIDGPTLVE